MVGLHVLLLTLSLLQMRLDVLHCHPKQLAAVQHICRTSCCCSCSWFSLLQLVSPPPLLLLVQLHQSVSLLC
jgi:hypothetical protein